MTEIELRGLTWDDPRGRGPLADVERAFRAAHEGMSVRVRWDVQPLSGFEQRPMKELVDEYDLIVADHPHMAAAAEQGFLLPIEELPDEFVGPSLESYRHAGQLWAVPVDAACHVLAYRTDRIQEAPTTWNELEQLVAKGIRCGVPLIRVHATMALISILASMNGNQSPHDTSLDTAGDRVPAALDRIRSLYELSDPGSLTWNPIDALNALRAGQIDIVPLTFGYAHYQQAGIRFGEILKVHTDATARGVLGGAGMAVSARSSEANIAIEFARFCGTAEVQRTCWSRNGGQPANRSAWDELASTNDFYRDTRQAIENAVLRPRHREFGEQQHEIGSAIHAWLSDRGDRGGCIDSVSDGLFGELVA